ncbi:MAG: methyltransferase [Bdellovibrionales bacterium]|nr:methyltransferase [Bdellovibrionales bacterium]
MRLPEAFQSTMNFKGWAIPGQSLKDQVRAQGDGAFGSVGKTSGGEDYTIDALCGLFGIAQLKNGHRFSTDDLLVAWYGQAGCARPARILDLGSGIGTIAQILAWKNPGVPVVSIEAQSTSVELAKVARVRNGLEDRWTILEGDFRESRVREGLGEFDLICGSPPYFPVGTGELSEHPQKQACRFELRGDVADYARVAAQHLAPAGVFACVFPNAQKERADQGIREAGLTVLKTRAVQLKEGDDPLLRVYLAVKSTDFPPEAVAEAGAALWSEPDLMIRTKDGRVSREYRTIKFFLGFPANG